jgi:hypothetical protein
MDQVTYRILDFVIVEVKYLCNVPMSIYFPLLIIYLVSHLLVHESLPSQSLTNLIAVSFVPPISTTSNLIATKSALLRYIHGENMMSH